MFKINLVVLLLIFTVIKCCYSLESSSQSSFMELVNSEEEQEDIAYVQITQSKVKDSIYESAPFCVECSKDSKRLNYNQCKSYGKKMGYNLNYFDTHSDGHSSCVVEHKANGILNLSILYRTNEQ